MKCEANLSIDKLIQLVEAELLRTGYGNRVIKRYQAVWNRLLDYMKERSLTTYNSKLGMDFLGIRISDYDIQGINKRK